MWHLYQKTGYARQTYKGLGNAGLSHMNKIQEDKGRLFWARFLLILVW